MAKITKLVAIAAIVIIVGITLSMIHVLSENSASQNSTLNTFLIGTGPGTWGNLPDLNNNYSLSMNLATSWISTRDDIHGWWSNYFLPEPLWNQSIVPHLITYKYFTNTWAVDYSAANLSLHRGEWLEDLRFVANHLKAPDDGHHMAIISLETEFNDPTNYENMDYAYWNQLMIDSRNAIKEIAPNVLVSYCIGGWESRFNDDISMDGALVSSMESMDFMSFQCMWGIMTDNDERTWLNGDDLRTNYNGVNWVEKFGNNSRVWDYMVDDIAANVKALSKYNSHIFLAHFYISDYLWGLQAQTDVVNDISQKVASLKEMGLFGISWMHYIDESSFGGSGFLFSDGSGKPSLIMWRELISKVRS